jgi:hypothetical protein
VYAAYVAPEGPAGARQRGTTPDGEVLYGDRDAPKYAEEPEGMTDEWSYEVVAGVVDGVGDAGNDTRGAAENAAVGGGREACGASVVIDAPRTAAVIAGAADSSGAP